jgi:hypothetical protein
LAELTGTPTRVDTGTYYVNVTCEDSHGAVGYYRYTLRVRGINRAPELFDGEVKPRKGDEGTKFKFYVTYRDLDYDPPSVIKVMVGDTPIFLELEEGHNLTEGIVFSNSTKLSPGTYSYYFDAVDTLWTRAEIVDDSTPGPGSPKKLVVSEKQGINPMDFLVNNFWFLVLLIIVLIIIGNLVLHKRKRASKKIKSKRKRPKLAEHKLTEEELAAYKDLVSLEASDQKISDGDLDDGESLTDTLFELYSGPDPEEGQVILICPECGEFTDESSENCPGCGVKFTTEKMIEE